MVHLMETNNYIPQQWIYPDGVEHDNHVQRFHEIEEIVRLWPHTAAQFPAIYDKAAELIEAEDPAKDVVVTNSYFWNNTFGADYKPTIINPYSSWRIENCWFERWPKKRGVRIRRSAALGRARSMPSFQV
jgi:hypothetical protein